MIFDTNLKTTFFCQFISFRSFWSISELLGGLSEVSRSFSEVSRRSLGASRSFSEVSRRSLGSQVEVGSNWNENITKAFFFYNKSTFVMKRWVFFIMCDANLTKTFFIKKINICNEQIIFLARCMKFNDSMNKNKEKHINTWFRLRNHYFVFQVGCDEKKPFLVIWFTSARWIA